MTIFSQLIVRTHPRFRTKGLMQAGTRVLTCALGRSGTGIYKHEGDGITPLGAFPLLGGRFRKDRFTPTGNHLNLSPIGPLDGWCDEENDRNYNQPVTRPYPASHECLMREDHLYDIFIDLDFNRTQRLKRGGSAIFFHLAYEDYRPTQGCVAISRQDMQWLLPRIGPATILKIQ